MNATLRNALGVAGLLVAAHAAAEITLYTREGFHGRSFSADHAVGNLARTGFNDRAESAVVRGERWEVCTDAGFGGRCVVLRPGDYPSLAAIGFDDQISSARSIRWNARIDEDRYAPAVDYGRRDNERLYAADVTSVHAVMGPPEQRCWVEREQVVTNRGDASVPGAIAGAVIGGILGHQVGGGRGKDLATAGGAVGGAIIGSNIGRANSGTQVESRDVQHCAALPNDGRVAYWDVTYVFRGLEHRVQMTAPPGPTLAVNEQGEPRV